ncbi:hypothetical protein [Flammeovirga aprica]|uniref:Outer membrane protein beta-barrel domain-containing protein n=1 Tax=Flammeovirga aprica JL-4 TaxID=694437 RepID=A0A7X9RY94_9BACT|nr:hypothetical protein [Flammeovirga aprica]NME70879.1 hypothetical protein [Flammeovirga aprica JL-4]
MRLLYHKNIKELLLVLLVFLLNPKITLAQLVPTNINIETAADQLKGSPLDSITINGGVRGNFTVYSADGIEQRRDPINWQIGANLSVKTKFFTVPFSVQLSHQQRNFTHPFQQDFNQFGFSPTYKGVTLHLGYRSMNLSEFSLAGTQFLGVGLEVKKKNFPVNCSLMYGRINKAFDGTEEQAQNVSSDLAVYDRWAYGGRVQWGNNDNNLGVLLFKAKDDITSITPEMAVQLGAKPAENLITEIQGKKTFNKRLTLAFDYAFSAYTRDITTEEITIDNYSYLNNLGGLFSPRASSDYNHAFVGEASLAFEKIRWNVKYRNIGPSFRTMGSPFLANDLDDITLGTNFTVKQRFNFAFNGGLQRNNLRETKASQSERWIGSANVAVKVSDRSNINFNFSNFSTSTQRVVYAEYNPQTDMDSLSFQQVTRNANLSSSIGYGKKIPNNLNISLGYQNTFDSDGVNATFYNFNINNVLQLPLSGTQITVGGNMNRNESDQLVRTLLGPSLSVSQPFFQKKLRSTITFSGQQAHVENIKESEFLNTRLAFSYNLLKQHRFSLSTSYLMRKGYAVNTQSFNEIRTTFTYSYNIKLK